MLKPDARGLYHLKHPEKVKGEDFVVIVPHWYVNILLRIGYTPFEETDPAIPPDNPFNQLPEGDRHEDHEDRIHAGHHRELGQLREPATGDHDQG